MVHEYFLIQALVERVEAEARARGATSIHRLSVRIGELAGVDVDLFTTAYHVFRERTICEGAVLDIQMVAVHWECPRCKSAIERGHALRCPQCSVPATLASGDEIILDRIDMEVPDV